MEVNHPLDSSFGLEYCGTSSPLIHATREGTFLEKSIGIFEYVPIQLNFFVTGNRFKNIISALLFIDLLPKYFKGKFFEMFQMVVAWNDHMKDVFIPWWVTFI